MKFSKLIFFLGVSLIWSCGDTASKKMTKNGYEYQIYSDESGDKAQPGQYVYFDLDILNDQDSVLQTYRNNPQVPVVQIPLEGAVTPGPANPLMDLLAMCSVGDSAGMFLPKDSLPQLPTQFEGFPFFEYRVTVVDILDEDEYKAKVEKEQKIAQESAVILQAREADVAEMIKSTIDKYNNNQLGNDLKVIEGDLKYVLHEEGTGPQIEKGKVVLAQYYGAKLDGEEFDNSFKRGRGFPFTVGTGSVIPGWDTGFTALREGSKATLFIPAELAYGEAGSPPNIGPNADLVFYVEIDQVQ